MIALMSSSNDKATHPPTLPFTAYCDASPKACGRQCAGWRTAWLVRSGWRKAALEAAFYPSVIARGAGDAVINKGAVYTDHPPSRMMTAHFVERRRAGRTAVRHGSGGHGQAPAAACWRCRGTRW